MDNKKLQMHGVVGIFPANTVGDDIEVYTDETRTEVRCKFFGLRQQAEREGDVSYFCLSDLIAPKETGLPDYLGLFVNSAGFGLDKLIEEFKADNDDYSYIMAEALADRLAEAFAEKLHEMVRTDLWGYSPDEKLSRDDLLRVKYRVSTIWSSQSLKLTVES